MDKQQKIAIVLLPILAIVLLAGGMFWKQQAASTPATYVDGTYEGAGKGFGGDIKVAVKIVNGKIDSIELLEHSETPGLGDVAAEKIIESVIAAQSTEVDTVSGATGSSNGTIEAINVALAQASGAAGFPDGTHEGVGKGFAGDIKVKVEVQNGEIVSINIVEINDTPGIGDTGANEVAQSIIDSQSLDVDVKTGATVSSNGLIDAVKNALGLGDAEEATAAPVDEAPKYSLDITSLADGIYTGSAEGFKSDIELSITVEGGKIIKIDIVSMDETPGIGDKGIETTIANVIEAQDVNVDVATGATYSYEGTINAIIAALEGEAAPTTGNATTEEKPAEESPVAQAPATSTPAPAAPAPTTPAPTTPAPAAPAPATPAPAAPAPATPAPAASGFKDGTYKASSSDSFYGDPITVTITVSGGKITNVKVNESETPDYGGKAAKSIASQIVSKQSADVDVYTGATVTSEAVINAAKDALKQAK